MEEVIVGVVGVLQFEVFEHRMITEYNVEIIREGLSYSYIRWIENDDIDIKKLNLSSDTKVVADLKAIICCFSQANGILNGRLTKTKGLSFRNSTENKNEGYGFFTVSL